MKVFTAFRPRTLISLPDIAAGGFRVKRYAVVPRSSTFDEERFRDAQDGLAAMLPPVDIARGRPGAAFLILHQGATGDYAVMAWWDRENELPVRVWTRQSGVWAQSRDDESFCVWDLELLWFERNAWIETVLSGAPLASSLDAYQRRVHPGDRR